MIDVWLLIFLFVDRPAFIFAQDLNSEMACEKVGAALVLATRDKVNYMTPPFVCVRKGGDGD